MQTLSKLSEVDSMVVHQALGLDQNDVALEYIQQAKELLHILEAEVHTNTIKILNGQV